MRKIICDCCGREITGNPMELCWSFRDRLTGDIITQDSGTPAMQKKLEQMKNREYCEECVGMSIESLFRFQGDHDRMEKEQEEDSRPKRKKLDEGKVIALKEAGWSAKMIAEEFGCSLQAVYKLLVRLKKAGRLEPEEGGSKHGKSGF